MAGRTAITSVTATAFTIATDAPESDGTLAWDATTIVVVEAAAGGCMGIGYTYGDASSADVIRRVLAPVVTNRDALGVPGCWAAMRTAVRNMGRSGIASHAISAVDTSLWDLKARLVDVALLDLLGASRDAVPVYGSGGFTSCSVAELEAQLGGWAASGIRRVKMKVGREPALDAARVRAARGAIGDAELFVDANGAYTVREALTQAERFAESGETWFEEPVASADVEGLTFIRTRAPARMEIAAGEYGYDLDDFRRLLDAGAVDVLQADVTRCGGYTGMLRVDALCAAHNVQLSTHTAPLLHAPFACAAPAVRHVEYFHDHVRIERLLLDGVPTPENGMLRPDRSRAGLGVEFRRVDAARFLATP